MKRILATLLLLCASLAQGATEFNILDTPSSGGGGTPGGTSGQIQYNNGGTAFGGFGSYNAGTSTVTVPNFVATGSATVANITSSGPATFGAVVVNSINSPTATDLTVSSNGASTPGATVHNNLWTFGGRTTFAQGSSSSPSVMLGSAVFGLSSDGGASLFWGGAGTSYAKISNSGFTTGSNLAFSFSSTSDASGGADTFIQRRNAANPQLGAADAASPIAQTLSGQSVVAGTSNTSGPAFTFQAPLSTGNATGGAFVFNSSYGGVSGTAQNAATQIAKIDPAGSANSGPLFQFGSGVGLQQGFQMANITSNRSGLCQTGVTCDSAHSLILVVNGAAVHFTGATGGGMLLEPGGPFIGTGAISLNGTDGVPSANQTMKWGTAGAMWTQVTSATYATGAPVTFAVATYTVLATDSYIIGNNAGAMTVTLPAASSFTGRQITIKTTQAQTVVSATSNVVPMVGGTAATAILAGTAGKWAKLVSDGSNWIIMEGN